MTMNASPHMDRGAEKLKQFVASCVSGTPFNPEDKPVRKLNNREDEGFGVDGFSVYATDDAISRIGETNEDILAPLGVTLKKAATSKTFVFALIDADDTAPIHIAKLNAK
jgi:hypothetical protein